MVIKYDEIILKRFFSCSHSYVRNSTMLIKISTSHIYVYESLFISLAKYLLIILYISTSPPLISFLSSFYCLCRSLFFSSLPKLVHMLMRGFLLSQPTFSMSFVFSLFNLIKMKFRQLTDVFLKVDAKVKTMSKKRLKLITKNMHG